MATCASFYYSTDGASQSDAIPASAAPELVASGVLTACTLIFSEDAGTPQSPPRLGPQGFL